MKTMILPASGPAHISSSRQAVPRMTMRIKFRMFRLYNAVLALVIIWYQIAPSMSRRMYMKSPRRASCTSLEMSNRGNIMGNQNDNNNMYRRGSSSSGTRNNGNTSNRISSSGSSDRSTASISSSENNLSGDFEPLYSQVRKCICSFIRYLDQGQTSSWTPLIFLFPFLHCVLRLFTVL